MGAAPWGRDTSELGGSIYSGRSASDTGVLPERVNKQALKDHLDGGARSGAHDGLIQATP